MDKPEFAIGDTVWRAYAESRQVWVTCPECGGTRTLKAVLFDGTEHIIECAGCSAGYMGPRGVVHINEHTPLAESGTVTGIQVSSDGVRYSISPCCSADACNVFRTKDEALARAVVLNDEWNEREQQRVYQKEKPTRTWSWNVHYHRARIREAEKNIEYHKAKLAAARVKAKEPESAETNAFNR